MSGHVPAIRFEATHGVIFIEDSEGAPPQFVPTIEPIPPPLVWKTSKVVAIGVLHFVDGPATLQLCGLAPDAGVLVFSGKLACPSGRMTVGQPEGEILATWDALAPEAHFSVFVDALDQPEIVWIMPIQ